jgi:hypothetical protein
MNANLVIQVKIGDIIKSTSRKSPGQIVEIDYEKDSAKVYYENEVSDKTEWIPLKGLNMFKREYKIMNLTEIESKNVLLAELSHVEKMYDQQFNCYPTFSLSKVDNFIIPLDNNYAKDFMKNPEENKLINFMYFFKGKINKNDTVVDAYYSIELAKF